MNANCHVSTILIPRHVSEDLTTYSATSEAVNLLMYGIQQ